MSDLHGPPAALRAAAAALLAVAALGGCGLGTSPDAVPEVTGPAPTTEPTAVPSRAPAPPAVSAVPVHDAALGTAPAPAVPAPVRLDISVLELSMAVDAVGVAADGSMQIPELGDHAGWYRFGPAPGDGAGAVVMAAHVDTWAAGLAPFARLRDLVPGDAVSVASSDGTTHSYTVSDVVTVAKAEIQLDAVFDRAGPARLVLVTCGGTFDRVSGHYQDNVVVTALPAG